MSLILDRLQRKALEKFNASTIQFIEEGITIYRDQGWTDKEIYKQMKNMEEVSPTLNEEIALAREEKHRKKVEKRLWAIKVKASELEFKKWRV